MQYEQATFRKIDLKQKMCVVYYIQLLFLLFDWNVNAIMRNTSHSIIA